MNHGKDSDLPMSIRECINSGMDYWNGGMGFFKVQYHFFLHPNKYNSSPYVSKYIGFPLSQHTFPHHNTCMTYNSILYYLCVVQFSAHCGTATMSFGLNFDF